MFYLDYLLNRITMYRLVLYFLIGLLVIAGILSLFGLVPYSIFSIALSAIFLVCICAITNIIFAKVFGAPTNVESVYITALILACVITPLRNIHDIPMLFWAGVLSMASKYMFARHNKHFFNPVGIALVMTAFGFGQSANWWMGNAYMMPFVLVGGLAITRKTTREYMVATFFVVALLAILGFSLVRGSDLLSAAKTTFLHSSYLFFGFIMLTEPLTTPPRKNLQMMYAALVGLMFPPQFHIFSLYSTPELALVAGNIFSYIVSPKEKLVLKLSEKIQLAPDIIDFVFKPTRKFVYAPGQYMEWTYQHPHTDSRGNRRYFTLASSPTEETIRIGVKFYEHGSSYKNSLQHMKDTEIVMAGQISGDFLLPSDSSQKLVLIAGGIGITPFRSMIKYLIDTGQKRDIVILFSNKVEKDIVYKDIFDEAEKSLGIKTFYNLTDIDHTPSSWAGGKGRLTKEGIGAIVPDWQERVFYLSGPHAMVVGFENTLRELGVLKRNIKKDFFPGFV